MSLSCCVPRSLEQYLQDVLTHSQECRSYVDGKTYLAFSNDERLKHAVERTLQIVGEAVWQAAKLDPSVVLWMALPVRSCVFGIGWCMSTATFQSRSCGPSSVIGCQLLNLK